MRHLAFLLLFAFLFIGNAKATHNYGGYISYEHINGQDYKITVHLYFDSQSPAIARQEVLVNFGDNSGQDSITRTAMIPHPDHYNIVVAEYETTHTYNGAGTYAISISDPNRTAGINNINNSVNVPLYLETQLRISPFGNLQNNSVRILDFMPMSCLTQQMMDVNITAYDEDGDYISYELVNTKGAGGTSAPGYYLPSTATVNLTSGQFRWTPQSSGLFQFTVRMSEYRNGILIASTLFDYAIFSYVDSFNSQHSADSSLRIDSCGNIAVTIMPGQTASFSNLFSYQSNSNFQTSLRCISEIDSSAYVFDTTQVDSNNLRGDFSWSPTASDLRCAPYPFYFRGSKGQLNHDLVVFIYVLDSALAHCDTTCFLQTVGMSEYQASQKMRLKVAPNPFKSTCTIRLPVSLSNQKVQVEIYDRNGRLMRSQFVSNQKQLHIERNNLPSGVYFYQIRGEENEMYSGKLMIVN